MPPGIEIASWASGLIALGVYAATLNPTVSHGDSGEMIAVAHTLGVAHPPGFPLYALLAKLAALLPLGTVAWRVNLFSALCDAAAAALLCRATVLLTRNVWAGCLAASAFAFSPIVWPYAVTAEVFALNNLFAALMVLLTTVAWQAEPGSPRARRLALGVCFAFGLGLANHPILLLLAGPVVALTALRGVRAPDLPARLAQSALAFGLGLLPYLYLFLAPHFGSEIAWGDTASLSGFLDHVLRREYGTMSLAQGPSTAGSEAVDRLAALLGHLVSSTLGLLPLLVLVSLSTLLRPSHARASLRLWAVGLATHLVLFASLSNLSVHEPLHATVQERFWQQAVAVLAVFAGVGFAVLAALLPRWLARLAIPATALLLSAALAAGHWASMDQRRHVFFRAYGRAILDSLPEDAILLVTSDEAVGSVRYLQQIEGVRRDVRVFPTGQVASPWFRKLAARHFPDVVLPEPDAGGRFTFRVFLDRNLPASRVFLLNKVPWLQTLEGAYASIPAGLADEVRPKASARPLDLWVTESLASLGRFDPSSRGRHDGAWERYVEAGYWKQWERFGLAVARGAAGRGSDPAVARLVVRALEPVAERHPAPSPAVFKNLGVACQFLARGEPAAAEKMVVYWRRYLAVGPESDPDRAAIRAILDQTPARTP